MGTKPHTRDEMLVVRVSAELKGALQLEAKAQNRSVGNLVEWLLLRGLEAGGDREAAQRRAGGRASRNLPRKRLPRNAADAPHRRPRQKHPSRQRKGS